jgi:glutaredoxin
MADIKIYTAKWSADCDQAKEYLDDEGIFYEEIDIDTNSAASRLVEEINGGRRVVPTFDINGTTFALKPFDWKRLQKELEQLGIDD